MSSVLPLLPSEIYHIYTHANGNENLFREDDNYKYFLRKYSTYIYPVAETYAYCLMPNHFHLMVKLRKEKVLFNYFKNKGKNLEGFENLSRLISQQFSNLLNGYTKAYNKRYSRIGNLFQSNFRRKIIESDDYFTALLVYIHKNPVHHGFVTDINDWPYSSWHSYISNMPTWVARDQAIAWFGNIKEFVKFHETDLQGFENLGGLF